MLHLKPTCFFKQVAALINIVCNVLLHVTLF